MAKTKFVPICVLIVFLCADQCVSATSRRSNDESSTSLLSRIIDVNQMFESSLRSVIKSPLTSAVYALSMLVGVVAMLAFYESPVSPMPVPPLPDPPVGRFPPEHPIWPPPSKDAVKMNDKKRIGSANNYPQPNVFAPQMVSQKIYPQNNYQHLIDAQKTSDSGYQQLLNLIENGNSKLNYKQNKFDLLPELETQLHSLFASESKSNETKQNNKDLIN